MALRELVTGSDMCTASDAAGPSNAAASLANTLFGGSAKQQERLSELPGLATAPGPSSHARVQLPTMEQAVHQTVHGKLPAIPGLMPGGPMGAPMVGQQDVDEFVRSMQQPGPMPDFDEFDEIYDQSLQGGHHAGLPPMALPPPTAAFTHSFQAFFHSGREGAAFLPLPAPPIPLSLPEKCKIRDRSSILARQLFAQQGHSFADAQVRSLLHSLHIDAEALPAQVDEHKWDDIYRSAEGLSWADELAATEVAVAGQAAARQLPGNGWVDEFAGLSLSGPDGWADEFSTQVAASRQSGIERALQSGDGMRHTQALVETLSQSDDPKMKSSKFLQFVSKMSRGEVILEDNQVKEVPKEVEGWAREFDAEGRPDWVGEFSEGGVTNWVDEFDGGRGSITAAGAPDIAVDWAQEFANGVVDASEVEAWANDFTNQAEEWEREYQQQVAQLDAVREATILEQQQYVFSRGPNPFLNDTNSFAKAKDLFRSGLLSEAVLALEAEVQRHEGNVDAWRMLGNVHAENDDDRQAIAALSRALAADPNNLEALLSLGVSHTNELDQSLAVNYLNRWLHHHPQHRAVIEAAPTNQDKSQSLGGVINLFERAANLNAQDADVHAALGVLYNLSRDYDRAVASFRYALSLRNTDYSLWNKLGATLANSNHSSEAIAAYQKALDTKPNYMRAWTNMGIANANLGMYAEAAKYYARALTLNPQASSVWGYLRTAILMSGRHELMQGVDEEDIHKVAAGLGMA